MYSDLLVSQTKLSEVTPAVLALLRVTHCSGMGCVPWNLHFLSQELWPLRQACFFELRSFSLGVGVHLFLCLSATTFASTPHIPTTVVGASVSFRLERESTYTLLPELSLPSINLWWRLKVGESPGQVARHWNPCRAAHTCKPELPGRSSALS